MSLEYFHVGDEYEFSFYRLPKELIRDPTWQDISMEAKVLYGCMLDRHELSAKNGWHDEEGRVFIYYTFDQICSDLHVSRKKAASMLDELENRAGLIIRSRQGQGNARYPDGRAGGRKRRAASCGKRGNCQSGSGIYTGSIRRNRGDDIYF